MVIKFERKKKMKNNELKKNKYLGKLKLDKRDFVLVFIFISIVNIRLVSCV